MRQAEIRPVFENFFSGWWDVRRPGLSHRSELACADLGCASDFLKAHPEAEKLRNVRRVLEMRADDLRREKIMVENSRGGHS